MALAMRQSARLATKVKKSLKEEAFDEDDVIVKPKSVGRENSDVYVPRESDDEDDDDDDVKRKSKDSKYEKKKVNNNPQDVDSHRSEYEQLRLRNIQSRNDMFRGLMLAKEQVTPRRSSASKRGLSSVKKETGPARKSLRLQRIDPDTGLTLPEKEPSSYTPFREDSPERYPVKELNLDDICEDSETAKSFMDGMRDLTESKRNNNDLDFSGEQLKRLKITPERVAKVVPNRIFSLAIHPSESKLLLAAGAKWGSIGLWDVHNVNSKFHGVHMFKHHVRPVNCLTFSPYDCSKLISTSYDGTVRLFDLNKQTSSTIFSVPEDSSAYTTYHSQVDESSFLVSLGKTGKIGLVDSRGPNDKPVKEYRVYDRASPKMVNIHPLQKFLFVAPSSKGDCGIFDLRMDKGGGSLLQPLVSLIGHSKSVSSATFSSVTGKAVATVCYDNKIRLFDVHGPYKKVSPTRDILHNNQTGRWLTTFKAEWHPLRDDMFFVGSMKQPRQIDIYNDKGESYSLQGEELASVCSIVKCHPTQQVVVGGNSSGRVHVFM